MTEKQTQAKSTQEEAKPQPAVATRVVKAIAPVKLGILAVLLIVGVVVGVLLQQPIRDAAGSLWAQTQSEPPEEGQGKADGDGGVTLYQSGMHPWIITTEPGNCPICGMKLEPIDPSKLTGEVTIDPVVVQNMGIRTAAVTQGPVTRTIRTVGTVEVAEPQVRDINLRVSGWIESLAVDFVGAEVKAGDRLFDIYSPELYAAQEEYLLALRNGNQDVLLNSARDRLLNFGLTEDQVDAMTESKQASRVVPILSTHTGVVIDKHANEGMRVDPGMRIFRIADLSKLWVQVTLYEYQLPFVEVGLPATMTLSAMPGRSYEGQVVFVDPTVDPRTRAVQVRLAFDNPDGKLKPGMYANVTLTNTLEQDATLAPREAVIDTGRRTVAFVSLGQGRFEPRSVTLGVASGNNQVQVLDGLSPGERVVVSGQFLLDSEASVRESLARIVRGDQAVDQKPVVATTAPGIALSAAAQAPLDELARNYLAIQDALTRDKLDQATERLAAIRGSASLLAAEGPAELGPLAKAVEQAAAIDTQKIDAFRDAFGPLSDAVIALVSKASPSKAVAETIYVTHCPMVNKDWLQTTDTIRNPYATYMLNCGSIERAIAGSGSGGTEAAPSNPDPEVTDDPAPPKSDPPGPSIEPAAQQAIDQIITAYLAVQDNLTRDKLDHAEHHLATIRQQAEALEAAHPGLGSPIAQAATIKVGDIEAFLKAFDPLSNAVIALVQQHPPSRAVSPQLQHAYCPMVKKAWLQGTDELRNPYATYMLNCGEFREVFWSGESNAR